MITIDVLVCNLDGSQHFEKVEVSDDWYGAPDTENTENAGQ